MAVTAIGEYPVLPRDVKENFHGNIMVFVGWDQHLMISSPMAFPLPPDMPFGALVKDVMPAAFAPHPDWEKIDWNKVNWLLNGEPFEPDMEKSLADNGIDHKSVIRLRTPGLNGIKGSCS